MPVEFKVVRAFPAPDIEAGWRSLLVRVDLPSHYTAPEFFLEKHLSSRRPFAVLSVHEGKVTGVLTGLHEPHRTISGLPERPQLCLDRHTDQHAGIHSLMSGLLKEAGSSDLIEIHSWGALDAVDKLGFRLQQVEGPVLLDLKQSLDALFMQLDKKRRNNIRLAIKNHLIFSELSDPTDFLGYYQDVYCRWRSTARKQIMDAETSFEGFERRFKLNANRKLFVAKFEGKIVAGAFVRFQTGGLVEFAAGSSVDEFLHLKPNDFLQWQVIEWARNQGFTSYSLGGSGQFHREFGGVVISAYRYRADRTWLHHHDLRSGVATLSRKLLHIMPPTFAQATRRVLQKIAS